MKHIILSFILSFLFLFSALTLSAQQIPYCMAPDNLSIYNLTSTSVSLYWGLSQGQDIPTLYTLTLRDKDRNIIMQDNDFSSPNLNYDLDSLYPNTTYTVELTGNCNASSSGYSKTTTITFTTLCGPINAPYTQNFDTLTALPRCTFSSGATISYAGRYGKGLTLHPTELEGSYFIFPGLIIPSDSVECSFWVKASDPYAFNVPVQVGLVADPADISGTFEPIYSCLLSDLNWKEIRMNTSTSRQSPKSSAMIAIFISSGYDTYVYVDDVSIHHVPSCIRPENFAVSDILPTSATLSWTTTNADNTRIYISSPSGSRSELASSSPYTLNNLIPNTKYTLSIRGICSATDSSEICPQTISFTTKCDTAPTALFNESFDTLSVPNTIPVCWETGWLVKHPDITLATPFTSTTAQVHTGTRAMVLQNQPNGTTSYLSSQLLPIDEAGKYTLSVWVYRQNASQYDDEALRFWVAPSYNSTSGATLLGTVPLCYNLTPAEPTANLWYNYEYVINSVGDYYILVEGVSEEGAMIYLDDVEVKLTPSCMKVSNIRLTHPSSSDVNLIWTPGNTESQWAVNYTLTQNASIVANVSDTVTSSMLNINNLTPSTVYSITGTIKALCTGGDTAVAVPFSNTFTTMCLPLSTLPYRCGFESSELSVMTNPLPLCWQRSNDAQSSYNGYPNATSSADLTRTGSGYLRFYPSSSVLYNYGSYQMAVLPEIDTLYSINSLQMTFYGRAQESNTVHTMIAGVISNPNDLSTFVAVDSFPVYGNVYKRFEILFDNYSGNGRYMALLVNRAEHGQPVLCIDDLVIEPIPACRNISVDDVEISDITDGGARVTMNDATVTSWQYAYGVAGTSVSSLQAVSTTSTNIQLTNLIPSTSYSVFVRRVCGTEVGNWSDAVNFTTTCPAASVPYYESFESYSVGSLKGCYVVQTDESDDTLSVFSSAAGTTGNQLFNNTATGSKGLSSSDGSVHTPVEASITASTYVHLEAGKNYEISLYAKKYNHASTNYSYKLSFVYGFTTSALTPVGSFTVTGDFFERYVSTFAVPATGNYYVGFTTTTNLGSKSYYPYIDDIRIEEISCSAPTSIAISSITPSSAVMNINSSAASWLVAVSSFPIDVNNGIDADIMLDTVTSPVVNVTGLRTNSDYYYTVRSICANGEVSAWSSPGSFHTHCSNVSIPYTESFEQISSTRCWGTVGTGSVNRATDVAHSGKASMLLSSASVVSPQINVVSLAPYMLSAWVYSGSTNSSVTVGVMNDPDDVSTFEIISSFNISSANSWMEINTYFDILNDSEYSEYYNARYIIIIASGGSQVYVDDLNIDFPPSCIKPAGSSIANVTATSATIDWTEPGEATQWRIRLVPANGGSEVSANVSSHPYTVSGLNPSTQYTAYLSSVCSLTDLSPELNIGHFTTSCGVVTAPYSEDFESQTVKITPACWNLTGTTTYLSVERVWGVHEISGNRSIRMWNWGVQDGDALINSPEIYIPTGQSFELAYDYCHQATSGPLYVKIRRRGETTFTNLASHRNTGESTTEGSLPIAFHSNSVPLTAYAGDTVTIQFFNVADDIFGDGAIFVDNVKVRVINPCSMPAIAVTSLSDVEAKIQITDSLHTSWQYAYGPQGFNPSAAQPLSTNSRTISLSGLSTFTFYDVYVRAVCGTGSYSDWVKLSLQTTSSITPIPYVTDFSNPADNDLWVVEGDATNSFVFGVDPAALINSSHALYVSSDGLHYGYNTSIGSQSSISRLFYFDEEEYVIDFDWQCTGGKYVLNGVADYGRFYLMPAYQNVLPQGEGMYYKYYFWDDGIIPLDGDTCIQLIPNMQHTTAILDMTGRAGAYRLVFFWFTEQDGGNAHYPLSVANLSVKELTCEPVENLVVPEEYITRTSAYVHCNNSTSSLRWVISTSTLIADSVMSGVSTTDTFTVRNLLPSTEYHLFVSSECSSTDVSPWSEVVFRTLCGPITTYPHTEDFENTYFSPYCWTSSGWSRYNNKPYQYAHGNGCAHAGFGSNQPLVSPELMFDADRQYFVSFWLFRSDRSFHTDQMKVYISPSTSLNDATLLQSYTSYDPSVSTQALVFYSIDLPEELSGIYHIIFVASGSGSYQTVYLDDVTFGIYPICRELKNAPVVEAHTSTTVTVSSAANNYTSTQYGVAPYSVNVTAADIVTIVDTSYITGLEPNTSYSIFARGICSFSGDTTGWSPSVRVTTRIDDCFEPDGLSFVVRPNDTMAVIKWNPVPNMTHYQVILSSSVGADTFVTTATSLRLSSLVANTYYTFAIRTACVGRDYTGWATLNFTTLHTPATIPYHTGFEPTDDNALWNTINSAFSNFTIGTDGGGRHIGVQGLYVTADGSTYTQTYPTGPGYGNYYGTAYITRTLYFHEAGNYEVAFDWKCDPISDDTYGYYDAYGRAYIAPVDASLPVDVSTYSTSYPVGSIELVSQLTGSQTWQRSSFVVEVPEAGYRDVVFQWYSYNRSNSADQADLSDYPLAIDNLDVTRVYCLAVNKLTTLTYSDTSATILVNRSVPVELEYALLTVNSQDSITTVFSVDADTIVLNGLTPQTTYYLFVRQVCDSVYSSSWRTVSFKTTVTPAVLPYVCDFENTDENNNWLFFQSQQNQFIIGPSAYGDGTHSLYVSSDGSSNTYNNTAQSYAFAARTFYLTPGDYYCSYDWHNAGESMHDYARLFFFPESKSLPVGTFLFDLGPNTLPYTGIAVDGGSQMVNSPSMTFYEERVTISEEGSYNLVAAWMNDAQNGDNPPFVLDNVNVRHTSCYPPSLTVVSELQVPERSSAIITSSHTGMDIVYAVSTTTSFADAVLVDTIINFSGCDTIVLNGISPSTSYYLLARSLCSPDDYSVMSRTSFITPCGLITKFPYRESFESISTTYISGMISSICWTPFNATSSTTGYPRYQASTNAADVSAGNRSLKLVAHKNTAMVLMLPEMADISPLRLTFDVRYDADKSMPVLTAGYLTDPSDATSFVAVCTTAVSTTYRNYTVQFAGAPVGSRIAFRFVGGNTGGKAAYLDNVNVLHVVDGDSYTDTVCYSEDYTEHGFNIVADSIPVGLSTHYRTVPAIISSDPDTLYTLTLLKRAEAIRTYRDTICGGQPYVSGIWNIQDPQTRRYFQVTPGASQYGCDSIVELFLEVVPVSHVIRDTICKGQSYQFGTQTITTAGCYTRTYQTTHSCTAHDTLYLTVVPDSVFNYGQICEANLPYRWYNKNYYAGGRYFTTITGMHGCQQTAVLDLVVFAMDTTLNVDLCTGGSVRVIDTIISTPGTYVLRRISRQGCDVNYHVNVTETPIVPEEVYDFACEGKPYSNYGIRSLIVTSDTVVHITTRSSDNLCDSMANINLTYVAIVRTDTFATIPAGSSITWHDQTYNKSGNYSVTLYSKVTGCDSIVTLHLTVGVGVEEVVDNIEVILYPNPAESGEQVFVTLSPSLVSHVAMLQVVTATGAVVETQVISSDAGSELLVLDSHLPSGVYFVRLTMDDGKVAIRKLLIE